jgi:hypothetical protein
MTSAARVLAEVEAAIPDLARAGKLIAACPTDAVLREVLEATYDPFLVEGLHEPLPPMMHPDRIDEALSVEWTSFYAGLRSAARRDLPSLVAAYRVSEAWPVYARVLAKRFVDVPFDVANQWGTLPVFRCAMIEDPMDEAGSPFGNGALVRVPLHARRCLTLVRDLLGTPSAYFLDLCGNPITAVDPQLRTRLENPSAWESLESDGPYEEGVMVDGWIMSAGPHALPSLLRAFDAVPLSLFRRQQRTRPYAARLADLSTMPFSRAPILPDATAHDRALSLEEPGAVFVISLLSAYPFASPSSWRWLRKGSVRFA